jgi:hypothetical protein
LARLPEGFEDGDQALYVAARRSLLDAVAALLAHRDSLVLVSRE